MFTLAVSAANWVAAMISWNESRPSVTLDTSTRPLSRSRNRLARELTGNLRASGRTAGVLLIVPFLCAAAHLSGVAQTSPSTAPNPLEADPPALRIPPPAARAACVGKREGESCAFHQGENLLEGECLSGREIIFACRPFHLQPNNPLAQPDGLPAGGSKSPLLRWMLGLLLATCGGAVLAWFALYHSMVRPLSRLRRVTRQLADGDLSARVGEGLVERHNAVSDLGRDVDRMAARIESLVGAHRRLIRDVSHELRSPLARLNVALELARQTAGSTLTAPFARIERESDRLDQLISQLLMLTRLESESRLAERAAVDLAPLCAEIVADVDFEARGQGRRVVLKSSEPVTINGNHELLRQAIENLVRNASQHTAPDTAVEVSLRRITTTPGPAIARIIVEDHGPGVPEASLVDIFRPFFRVAGSRSDHGAGVGLAIADRAVMLHGGTLRARNAPQSGLILEIELPIP